MVDSESGTVVRLTMNVADNLGSPSVSADGSRIVATAAQMENEVWRVPFGPDPVANGRSAVRILEASLRPLYTSVARDGRTMLFTSTLVGSRNLFTAPIDGGAAPKQITSIPGAPSHRRRCRRIVRGSRSSRS